MKIDFNEEERQKMLKGGLTRFVEGKIDPPLTKYHIDEAGKIIDRLIEEREEGDAG